MLSQKVKQISSTRTNKWLQFPKNQIRQIVAAIEAGLDRKEACAKYGMAYATLTEWMNKYGSSEYHANKRLPFPAEKKRTIVRQVLDERITKKEACLAYNIQPRVLNAWVLQYKREDHQLASHNHSPMPSNIAIPNNIADELQQAKLKIAALETMIDIAEQQFKIAIRKKSGAKQ